MTITIPPVDEERIIFGARTRLSGRIARGIYFHQGKPTVGEIASLIEQEIPLFEMINYFRNKALADGGVIDVQAIKIKKFLDI